MEHKRRKSDGWPAYMAEITKLVIALTALVAALSSLGIGWHNSKRLDNHREDLEVNHEVIKQNAKAINEIANTVGAPVTAVAPPPLTEQHKD